MTSIANDIYGDAAEWGMIKTYIGATVMVLVAISLFILGVYLVIKSSKTNTVVATVIDSVDCINTITNVMEDNVSRPVNVTKCLTTIKYKVNNIEYTKKISTPQYRKGDTINVYYENDPNTIILTTTSSGTGFIFICLCLCLISSALLSIYLTKRFKFLAAGSAVSGILGGNSVTGNLASGLVGSLTKNIRI